MFKKWLCATLAVLMVLAMAACGTDTGATTDPDANVAKVNDAYTPYEQTITLTKGATVIGAGGLPSGDDFGNNVFTRYLLNTQNIKTEVAWSVDASTYNSKVALCITSQQIPDVLVVNRSIFKQLVDNDLLADMTQAYEDCISPFLKEQYDSYGEELFDQVTVDGKLMGIPSPSLNNCQNVLWIRKDWLEKTGMSEPKTLADVEALAKKFQEMKLGGDNTIGITTTSDLYTGYNSTWGLDTIFSYFGAYPGVWLEENGQPVYGSTKPEVKEALETLRRWYSEGILDREFAVRDESSRQQLIGRGQCGMYFGVWWPSNGVPDVVELNKEADWIAVSAPLDGNGQLKAPQHDPLQEIVVVSKNCAHPEAVIKALNAGYDVLRCNTSDTNPYAEEAAEAYNYFFETSPQAWGVMPIGIEVNYSDVVGRVADELEAAVAAQDPSLLTVKGYEACYEYILYNSLHPKENRVYYHEYLARIVGAQAATDGTLKLIPTCFYGTTRTMSTLWSSLKKMENEAMLKIVMGEEPVSSYDDFIDRWQKSGGSQITSEVQKEVNGG